MVELVPKMAPEAPDGYVSFVGRHLAALRLESARLAGDAWHAEEIYPEALTDVAARWRWLELLSNRFGRPAAADDYLRHVLAERAKRWRAEQIYEVDMVVLRADPADPVVAEPDADRGVVAGSGWAGPDRPTASAAFSIFGRSAADAHGDARRPMASSPHWPSGVPAASGSEPTTPTPVVEGSGQMSPATRMDRAGPVSPATRMDRAGPVSPATPVDRGGPVSPATPVDRAGRMSPGVFVDGGGRMPPATPLDRAGRMSPGVFVDGGWVPPAMPEDRGGRMSPAVFVDGGGRVPPAPFAGAAAVGTSAGLARYRRTGPGRSSLGLRQARFLSPLRRPPAPIAEAAIAWWHAYVAQRRRKRVAAVIALILLVAALANLRATNRI